MRNTKRTALLLVSAALWIVPTAVAQQPNTLTSGERADGWVLLFDGTSLTDWSPRLDTRWEVADGTISAIPESGRGLIATTEHYANFQLKVDFWIDDTANSGVFIRCPAEGPITHGNVFEVNIFDPHTTWPTGSINEVAKIQTMSNTVGKWNTFEIISNGDHLAVKLNGETTVDARSDRHEHGPIALQCNASGQVRFRNVKIKTLEQPCRTKVRRAKALSHALVLGVRSRNVVHCPTLDSGETGSSRRTIPQTRVRALGVVEAQPGPAGAGVNALKRGRAIGYVVVGEDPFDPDLAPGELADAAPQASGGGAARCAF